MLDDATATLETGLAAGADEATRLHWERYLKGTARFRGVPMAGVRSAYGIRGVSSALPTRPLTSCSPLPTGGSRRP